MSVARLDAACIPCILSKFLGRIPPEAPHAVRLEYTRKLLKLLADAPDEMAAPEVVLHATALQKDMLGVEQDFTDIKRHFNALMLEKEDFVRADIAAADEPLRRAAQYALLGNYIDFGAMDSVDENRLQAMLADAENMALNEEEFARLKADLAAGGRLLYLTDNCGEVLMDKLFLEEILRQYPALQAEVLVRGEHVVNDATMDDAVQVGLPEVAPVFGNGTAIGGTCLERLSPEAAAKVDAADVLIAKGQGNFETLRYCGKNVYYFFLCKCDLFATRFAMPRYSGMLLNDLRMK